MNIFVGVGKITDVNMNGKVLKFTLAIHQEKPCFVPCLLFEPSDEVKAFVEHLQASEQVVAFQGRVSSYDFEYKNKTIRKIDVITYAGSIKII